MLIDTNSLEFIEKSLTRAEAKKVHKDLPEGGQWRTMNGHHVYIVNGKIVAGAVSGVTKAKKMTKATMAEHQAKLDAKGKKTNAKKPSKPTAKATKPAKPKSGASAKGQGSKKATAGKTAPAAKKSPVKPSKKEKAQKEVKAAMDSMLPAKKEPPKAKTDTNKRMEDLLRAKAGTANDVLSWLESLPFNAKKYVKSATGNDVGLTRELFEKYKSTYKKPVKTYEAPEGHIDVYHGTKLPNLQSILDNGFEPNGSEDDFGDAAYFKSPSFDKLDHEDEKARQEDREKRGFTITEAMKQMMRGNDTARIVRGFSMGKEPAVIHATIPKEHVLDCTKGRPKELDDLIDAFDKAKAGSARIALLFKHLLGEDMTASEAGAAYQNRKPELEKAWGGKFFPSKISPYEVYAKKNGIKAIVDKLKYYDEEGWQLGVYDPSIIKIHSHGKGIRWNDETQMPELLKALMKQGKLPYCMLHHIMGTRRLHLFIGASGGKKA
jgi:hypothetical protein